MPPIGEAMLTVSSSAWHEKNANVLLTIFEMKERDLAIALTERRLDVALAPSHMLPLRVARLTTYREHLFVALPASHALAQQEGGLTWAGLK